MPPYGSHGGFGGGPGGYGPPPGLPYAPAASPEEGVTTVFVGGVDTRAIGEPELFYAFSALGPVSGIKVPRGDKGCAFVTFQYRAHAERAYELMQGYVLGPCRLRIEWGKAQAPARGGAAAGPYGAADGYGGGGGMGYGGSRFGGGGGFIDDQVPPGLSREAWAELQHTGGHAGGGAGDFEGSSSGGGGGFDGRGYDGQAQYYPGGPAAAAAAAPVPAPEPWITPESVRGNPYYEPLSLPGYSSSSSDAAAPSSASSSGDASAAGGAPGGGPSHAAGSYFGGGGGVGSGYGGGGYGGSVSGYPPHVYPQQHAFQQAPHQQQHPYGPQPSDGPEVHPAVRAARGAVRPTFTAAQADCGSVLPGTTRAAAVAGNKAWGVLHAATATAAFVAATPGGPPTDSLSQPLEGTPAAALLAAGAS
jgi:hypothetical protein